MIVYCNDIICSNRCKQLYVCHWSGLLWVHQVLYILWVHQGLSCLGHPEVLGNRGIPYDPKQSTRVPDTLDAWSTWYLGSNWAISNFSGRSWSPCRSWWSGESLRSFGTISTGITIFTITSLSA